MCQECFQKYIDLLLSFLNKDKYVRLKNYERK